MMINKQRTRVGAAFIPADDKDVSAVHTGSFRATSTQQDTANRLGPLQDLPGFWQGSGFSLIARPNFSGGNQNGMFLELNLIRETIEFTPIGSPVYNRGSLQEDIAIYGLTYLQRVTDAMTGGALHVEPGMWLNIPATTDPSGDASLARLATVPHGNAVCTVGHSEVVFPEGLPHIPSANTIPFPMGEEPPEEGAENPFSEYDLSQTNPFRTNPLPSGITQELINDPNTMLRKALQGQTISKITRLITATPADCRNANIPFITKNADAPGLEAVFAIEVIQGPSGEDFLQLQYSQTALLNFRGMSFPHVTVATLIKAF